MHNFFFIQKATYFQKNDTYDCDEEYLYTSNSFDVHTHYSLFTSFAQIDHVINTYSIQYPTTKSKDILYIYIIKYRDISINYSYDISFKKIDNLDVYITFFISYIGFNSYICSINKVVSSVTFFNLYVFIFEK